MDIEKLMEAWKMQLSDEAPYDGAIDIDSEDEFGIR
jgi:hypothetical protein